MEQCANQNQYHHYKNVDCKPVTHKCSTPPCKQTQSKERQTGKVNFQIGINAKGPLLTSNRAINSTMPKIFNNVTLNHKKSVTKWKNRQQNGLIITYHSILMLHLKKGSILNCLVKTNLLD